MEAIKRRWKWGPLSFGLATGIALWTAWCPVWGVVAFALGGLTTLLLVAVPVALDAASTRLVQRAHRLRGLEWPPPDRERVDALREAALAVAVEIENGAGKIGHYLAENRYWNTKNDPFVSEAFNRYSKTLSRDPSFSSLYHHIGSLHNEMDSWNRRISREYQRQLNAPRDQKITDKHRRELRWLRGRLNDARAKVAEYADGL
jgi:hypothetical protein